MSLLQELVTLCEGLGDGKDKLMAVINDAGYTKTPAHTGVFRKKGGGEIRMNQNDYHDKNGPAMDKWLITVIGPDGKTVGSAINTATKLKSVLGKMVK